VEELGITRLAAVAGGSLGGMQALQWAVLYGDRVDAIIPIASTHALQPQGVAWNAIARNAITADRLAARSLLRHRPRAYGRNGPSADGRTHHPVGQVAQRKFGRRLQFADDIRFEPTEPS
jgi:homoserine O-acetyltransferase